jgi:hypothetical protein
MTPMTVVFSARFSVSNTREIHANRQELRPCMKRLPRDWEIIKTSSTILQKKHDAESASLVASRPVSGVLLHDKK